MCRDNRFSFLVIGLLFSGTLAFSQSAPGIKFIENKNQWPGTVQYSARIPGGAMHVSPGKFQYYLLNEDRMQELHEQLHERRNEGDGRFNPGQMIDGHAVEVNFIGANPTANSEAIGQSSEY